MKADSFAALEQLRRLGNDAWFNLGDKDLATHITRTRLRNEGRTLSEITDQIRRALNVRATLLPMSDDRIETRVKTALGEISFQEFFVKERSAPEVVGVYFAGAEKSRPAPGVLNAVQAAEAIIVCPSNPVTSIGPILAVPGIRAALENSEAPIIGVSPIVGKVAISGPAHRLMKACGLESSPLGLARAYGQFLKTFVIAREDRAMVQQIEALGVKAVCSDIRMNVLLDKKRLAGEVLALLGK
jgi:LPPG:FO 2-phospho-L-lactate transferase